MADRETVIKALEICAIGTNSCTKCPLKDNCHGTSNAAMVAAIELLKEDEMELKSLGNTLNEAAEFNKKLMKKIMERAVKWDD